MSLRHSLQIIQMVDLHSTVHVTTNTLLPVVLFSKKKIQIDLSKNKQHFLSFIQCMLFQNFRVALWADGLNIIFLFAKRSGLVASLNWSNFKLLTKLRLAQLVICLHFVYRPK